LDKAVALAEAKQNEKAHGAKKNIALKWAVVALVLLLVMSSVLAVFEYNQTVSFQSEISQRDSTIGERDKVIIWLATALNLSQLALNMKPPLEFQYLTMLPDTDRERNITKIFLVSTEPGYSYDPYPWPFTEALRNALVVPTDNESVNLPHFGWMFMPENYSYWISGGDPTLMIAITVRNDYTPADAGNGNDPSAPIDINPLTGRATSVITLTAKLYSQNGSIIQATDRKTTQAPTAVGEHKFVLGSGETTQIVFYLSPPNQNVDHYELYVSYLSAHW
jgi:hypothetical protein